MNLRRVVIRVDSFVWNFERGRNVEHVARHQLTPGDVDSVLDHAPLFFRNVPGRTATHVMVGRDSQGRALWVGIVRTGKNGEWYPITAMEHRQMRRFLEERGL